MPESSRDIEIKLEPILGEYLRRKGIFEKVIRSWYPFKGQRSSFYSPVTDIAVGPFATRETLVSEYNELQRKIPDLINVLKLTFHANYNRFGGHYPGIPTYPFTDFNGNENARCFIAIEVESKGTTRKHKMGSLINASALGRVGIVIGFVLRRIMIRFLSDAIVSERKYWTKPLRDTYGFSIK